MAWFTPHLNTKSLQHRAPWSARLTMLKAKQVASSGMETKPIASTILTALDRHALLGRGWDDADANPYYGDPDFTKCTRVASLAYARHVQGTRLRRTDADVGLHPGLIGLAGTDTFAMALHWGRVYGLFDADDRAVLLPAAVIQLCHILNVNPTTTRNQDTHFFPFLYEVGLLWEQQARGYHSQACSQISHAHMRNLSSNAPPHGMVPKLHCKRQLGSCSKTDQPQPKSLFMGTLSFQRTISL